MFGETSMVQISGAIEKWEIDGEKGEVRGRKKSPSSGENHTNHDSDGGFAAMVHVTATTGRQANPGGSMV